jgi:hypothetical protein
MKASRLSEQPTSRQPTSGEEWQRAKRTAWGGKEISTKCSDSDWKLGSANVAVMTLANGKHPKQKRAFFFFFVILLTEEAREDKDLRHN